MLNEVILESFLEPKTPDSIWSGRPATIGNLIRYHVESGWMASSVPFSKTLNGIETVWAESLITTTEGLRMLYGESIKPEGVIQSREVGVI